jgi:Methylamine utilisation protein MauE
VDQSAAEQLPSVVRQDTKPLSNYFGLIAGVILIITGIAKIWNGLGNTKILAVVDPIFGVKFGPLMLAVGLVEIGIAVVCFFGKRQTLALLLVAWLSTSFVIYRLGLWWIDWHRPCNCLGNLTDALHLSPQAADNIMKVVLAYLLIGSYGLLLWQWRQRRAVARIATPSSTTFHCSSVRSIHIFKWLAVFVFITAQVYCQEYIKISGEITQFSYAFNQTNSQNRWNFPFTCIVGTNDWWIESDYPVGARETCYFDGTNVYSRLQATPHEGGDTNPSGAPHATITIAHCDFPLSNLGLNIPWLAFCSGNYLKDDNRVIALPVNDIPGRPDSFAYTDKRELFADAPGLPKRVELFTSKARFMASLADERLYRNSQLLQLRANSASIPTEDGILRFRYLVGNTTNFSGWALPTDFEFIAYFPNSKREAYPYVGGTGLVTSITKSARPENVFSTKIAQTVIDTRFRHKTILLDANTYVWTNDTVPNMSDPLLKATYLRRIDKATNDYTISSPQRKIYIILLLLVSTLSFLFVLLRKAVPKLSTTKVKSSL